MTRLAPVLDSDARHALVRTLAERVVRAGLDAGLDVVVVTSDHEVRTWAESLGVDVREDPGDGLDTAVGSATSLIDGPWIVAHADLPMVHATALRHVAEIARTGRTVLVPSLDGGTTIVGSAGAFPFSYGPGSFHRHLAAAPTAVVAPSAALSVDIDTSAQLIALRDSLNVPSLAE
jgi:2-phospho-L-lactate guanylyltransferase